MFSYIARRIFFCFPDFFSFLESVSNHLKKAFKEGQRTLLALLQRNFSCKRFLCSPFSPHYLLPPSLSVSIFSIFQFYTYFTLLSLFSLLLLSQRQITISQISLILPNGNDWSKKILFFVYKMIFAFARFLQSTLFACLSGKSV